MEHSTTWVILAVLALLQVKHFVFDFLYQPPFMWANKGNYKHIGGYLHAGLHSLASSVILMMVVSFPIVLCLALFELVVHYLVDYWKMNTNAKYGYKCNEHDSFWVLLGLDQLLHQITYIAIAVIVLFNL